MVWRLINKAQKTEKHHHLLSTTPRKTPQCNHCEKKAITTHSPIWIRAGECSGDKEQKKKKTYVGQRDDKENPAEVA